jgi:hypothetical protein
VKLTAAWTVIKSAISSQALSASVSAVQLAAATQAAVITLVYELGLFLLLVDREDGVSVDENLQRSFSKRLTDAFRAVDAHALGFQKSAQDAVALTDAETLSIFKNNSDLLQLVDIRAVAVAKALADGALTQDKLVNAVNKALVDLAAVIDNKSLATGKVVGDALAIADEAFASVSKSLTDTAGVFDGDLLLVQKSLFDVVGVTDDIDGALTIEDDQEVNFFKFTSNIAGATDDFARVVDYVRKFNDAGSVGDQSVLATNKALANDAELTDAAARVFDKGLFEFPSVADAFVSSVQKAVDDLIRATAEDQHELQINKIVAHVATVTDTILLALTSIRNAADAGILSDVDILEISKALNEALSVADTAVVSLSKPLFDSVGLFDLVSQELSKPRADSSLVSDDSVLALFKGLADETQISDQFVLIATYLRSIDDSSVAVDQLVRLLSKVLSDSTTVSDSPFKQPNLGKSDSVSVGSSGTLLMQGYCDITYFAEDFVGSSRSFT